MGALVLMYDMIMDRLHGSAGNTNEELRRRDRLVASTGSYVPANGQQADVRRVDMR